MKGESSPDHRARTAVASVKRNPPCPSTERSLHRSWSRTSPCFSYSSLNHTLRRSNGTGVSDVIPAGSRSSHLHSVTKALRSAATNSAKREVVWPAAAPANMRRISSAGSAQNGTLRARPRTRGPPGLTRMSRAHGHTRHADRLRRYSRPSTLLGPSLAAWKLRRLSCRIPSRPTTAECRKTSASRSRQTDTLSDAERRPSRTCCSSGPGNTASKSSVVVK